MASTPSFEVGYGTVFSSYDEIKAKMDEYQAQNSVELFIRDSRKLEAQKKQVHLNENLVYSMLKYTCRDCFRNKKWFTSIGVPFDIEMYIMLTITKDGQHLEVKKTSYKHSHPIGGSTPLPSVTTPSPSRRKREHSSEIKLEPEDFDSFSDGSKPRKKQAKSLLDSVSLGKQHERWQNLKKHASVNSDEEFAQIILNHWENDFIMMKPVNDIVHRLEQAVERSKLGSSSSSRTRLSFENGSKPFLASNKSDNYGHRASSTSTISSPSNTSTISSPASNNLEPVQESTSIQEDDCGIADSLNGISPTESSAHEIKPFQVMQQFNPNGQGYNYGHNNFNQERFASPYTNTEVIMTPSGIRPFYYPPQRYPPGF